MSNLKKKPIQPALQEVKQASDNPFPNPQDTKLELDPKFTGLARSVETFKYNGHNCMRICTLHIENGVVTKLERSDPYYAFELMFHIDEMNRDGIINLNNNWKEGKTLCK